MHQDSNVFDLLRHIQIYVFVCICKYVSWISLVMSWCVFTFFLRGFQFWFCVESQEYLNKDVRFGDRKGVFRLLPELFHCCCSSWMLILQVCSPYKIDTSVGAGKLSLWRREVTRGEFRNENILRLLLIHSRFSWHSASLGVQSNCTIWWRITCSKGNTQLFISILLRTSSCATSHLFTPRSRCRVAFMGVWIWSWRCWAFLAM